MIAEFGHFALVLALAVALVQTVVPLVGAAKRWPGWMAVAEPAVFEEFARQAEQLGFSHAACGPLVRSSYHADRQAHEAGVT